MGTGGKHIVDTDGIRYTLGRQLGRGGQGAVYEIEGGKLAAKIIFDRSTARKDRFRNQLTLVKRLPISDLTIAKPLKMLRPPLLGYIMRLLTGMVPLKDLIFKPKDEKSLATWYLAGGGLRRRLYLLAQTAEALSKLHGKGLVYSDPSPDNIFVSEQTDSHEVRLIDADNLHYQASPGLPSMYTPGYGAIELITRKSGVNTLTDAHAFSVLAFQTLTTVHPLMGDYVLDGIPELEDEALQGRLPWIDHPDDDTNRSSFGIPRDIVLSNRLQELAAQAFDMGLNDPEQRPGIREWAQRLFAARDATLKCPECSSTYYYFNQTGCPWCDHPRPTFVTASFYLWDPSMERGKEIIRKPANGKKSAVKVGEASFMEGDPLHVTNRMADIHTGCDPNAARLEVQVKGDRIIIKSRDSEPHLITSVDGNRTETLKEHPVKIKVLPDKANGLVHLGKTDKLHRVMGFFLRPGGDV